MKNIVNSRITLADKAYEALKEAIVTFELKPGQYIYENEIGSQLGVSRTPVREAFSRLRRLELIDIYPQKGAFVLPIFKKKVDEVRFVRESLEIATFQKIARNFSSTDTKCKELDKVITQIINEGVAAYHKKDLRLFFKLDDQFHSTMLEFMENKTLIDTIESVKIHSDRVRFLELNETLNMREILNQHMNIFGAVKTNDPARVELLLTDHFVKYHIDKKLLEKYPAYYIV